MIITIFSLIFLAVTLCGFSKLVWFFTIIDFFRLQYAIIALILLGLSIYHLNLYLITINFLTVAVNVYRIRHFLPRLSQITNKTSKSSDILSINTFKENQNYDDLAKVIKARNPKVLLLMEVTEDLSLSLKDLLDKYPYTLKSDVRDGFKICLYSKDEPSNQKITYHGASKSPLLQADIKINNKIYSIFSGHPKPSFNKAWDDERHVYFKEIEDIIVHTAHPKIILGDFNSVPWEDHFEKFLQKTEMQSTLVNHGYKVTWPVYCLPIGIPMDHILISKNHPYSNLQVGPGVHSDHYPIALNLD